MMVEIRVSVRTLIMAVSGASRVITLADFKAQRRIYLFLCWMPVLTMIICRLILHLEPVGGLVTLTGVALLLFSIILIGYGTYLMYLARTLGLPLYSILGHVVVAGTPIWYTAGFVIFCT